jgi:biotin--protein ligase
MKLFVSRLCGELGSINQWYLRQVPGSVGKIKVVKQLSGAEDEIVLDEAPGVSTVPLKGFDVAAYFEALDVKGLRAPGRRLIHVPEITSTQDVLRDKFDGWDGWRLAIVTDRQLQGRGRGENKWVSPEGCLMWSFQVIQTNGTFLSMLQYLVALALVKAVKRLPGGDRVAELVKIKWPNDLYCCLPKEVPAKIGGILCQSTYFQGQFVVTIGVGVNVTNDAPTRCLRQLFEPSPEDVSREALLAIFFTVLEPMLEEFERNGFSSFKSDYELHWMHSQQKLQLESGVEVVVEGLTDQGLLQACDVKSGLRYELQPDGNSLDWFKGLIIKRK